LAVADVAVTEVNLSRAIIVSMAVCTVTSSVLAASVCPSPAIPVRLGSTTAASIPNIATTMSSSTSVKPLLSRLILFKNLCIFIPLLLVIENIVFRTGKGSGDLLSPDYFIRRPLFFDFYLSPLSVAGGGHTVPGQEIGKVVPLYPVVAAGEPESRQLPGANPP
jgi:hypothetical protein